MAYLGIINIFFSVEADMEDGESDGQPLPSINIETLSVQNISLVRVSVVSIVCSR